LSKKYKPWSLQTIYKRLFCHHSVEEISKILYENNKADLSFLNKMFNSKNKKKKDNIRLSQKRKRSFNKDEDNVSDVYSDDYQDNDKYDDQDNDEIHLELDEESRKFERSHSTSSNDYEIDQVVIEDQTVTISNDDNKKEKESYINNSIRSINTIHPNLLSSPNFINYKNKAISSFLNKKTFLDKTNLNLLQNIYDNKNNNFVDKLSDLYDNYENSKIGNILSNIIYII
jgi:hypothetical protein